MPMQMNISQRQSVFLRLVEEQDAGKSVAQSRGMVGNAFGISGPEVIAIEKEGLAKQWPPLEEKR